MKLYVTRHGQTDWNVQKIVQGQTDTPLNETGIKQAYLTKRKLQDIPFDLILSSPLKRAKQTASIINEGRNIPIVYEKSLLEICYGENEGTSPFSFDYAGFYNIQNPHPYKNAENINNFLKRVYDFLDEIPQKYPNKTILLVCHNGVCKAIHTYFHGLPEDNDITKLGIENCEVVEYEM